MKIKLNHQLPRAISIQSLIIKCQLKIKALIIKH